LFAFSNDLINNIVSHWDSTGHKTDLGYAGGADSEYAYSKIGDATSTPQIVLIPYQGKQKWVAVFGAGFNAGVNSTYGSAIYVADLENDGKVLKRIDIPDIDNNDIANSIPAPVVAITPDSASSANYKGALIYFADLEGSLWKLNLTNQGTLFDIAQIFKADSTFDNDRLESFQVTASIGSDNNLWLYYGTGNQQKIQRISNNIENRIYGIKDTNFPQFKAVNKAATISQLKDTTESGAVCPTDADSGWYFKLDKNERITGQIAVHNETIFASRYIPNIKEPCKAGNASLSEHGYICGNEERETDLGGGIATGAVIFKDKVYIAITGDESGTIKDGDEEIGERKKNLIVLTPKTKAEEKKKTGVITQESWREIF
jgi:type IV pilus assembly protein PilY1